MQFAQFFHLSTGWNGKDFAGPKLPIEACGSDSVMLIDGRFGLPRAAHEARTMAAKRGFIGFELRQGPRFSDSRVIRKYEAIT